MSEADQAGRQEPKALRAAQSHCKKLERTVANLEKLIRIFAPTRTPQSIVEMFESRTTYGTIQQWRHGRRHIPPWAREIIRNKIALAVEAERALERGPGQSAGWRNVAGYVANR